MRKRGWLVSSGVIIVLAVLALITFLSMAEFDTTLEFKVRDAESNSWVWDLKARLQDRVINGYFQSDSDDFYFRFTGLKPGKYDMHLSAPGYADLTAPIELKRGANRIETSFKLTGFAIPDLSYFLVYGARLGDDYFLELRPVGTDGQAVLNHPAVDLWVGCRISSQMQDGKYAEEESDSGMMRGETIFRGEVEWLYDPLPHTVFRYSARISSASVLSTEAAFLVFDYLIVVPDFRKIDRSTLQNVLEKIWDFQSPAELTEYLDTYSDKFSYYVDTSWNVRR